jgi:hypothetical protein
VVGNALTTIIVAVSANRSRWSPKSEQRCRPSIRRRWICLFVCCCLHLQRLGWWRVGFDDVRGCGCGGGLCWKISDALDTSLVAILAKLSLEVGDECCFGGQAVRASVEIFEHLGSSPDENPTHPSRDVIVRVWT